MTTYESVHDKLLALCFPVAIFEKPFAKFELLFDSFAHSVDCELLRTVVDAAHSICDLCLDCRIGDHFAGRHGDARRCRSSQDYVFGVAIKITFGFRC